MDDEPDISVVIPTLGRHPVLARTLQRLRSQSVSPTSFEVIVVVDSEDDRPEEVERIASKLSVSRLIRSDASGASAARNRGWRAARSRLVLFLGNDILAAPALLEQHLRWHELHPEPEVGVLGRVRWSREAPITPFMRWLENGIQFEYGRIRGTNAGWGRFYTANASVKREMLERVGGFDEVNLRFLYEDLDLAYRMSKEGFRLLYNRRAAGEHLHPTDLDEWRARARLIGASERRFVALHPELPAHFERRFTAAAGRPLGRGRLARLTAVVPRWLPLLGPLVWTRAGARYMRALAPDFLAGWNEEGRRCPKQTQAEGPAGVTADSASEPLGPK